MRDMDTTLRPTALPCFVVKVRLNKATGGRMDPIIPMENVYQALQRIM